MFDPQKLIDGIRAVAIYDAAHAVMQMPKAHVHCDLGAAVNRLDARAAILALIEKEPNDV